MYWLKRNRRTSEDTWRRIQAEFERGGIHRDISRLASKHDVGENAIRERARKQKWKGYLRRSEARSPERLQDRRLEQIAVVQQMARELGYTPTKVEIEGRGIFFGRFYPFLRATDLVAAAQLPVRRHATGRSAAKTAAILNGPPPRHFKVRCCLSCGQKTTSDPCAHCGTPWDATPTSSHQFAA